MIAMTTSIDVPSDLLTQLSQAHNCLLPARPIFLFADFDGTLAPIVEVPSLAALPHDLKSILGDLAAAGEVVTVVISGRDLDDLQSRVGLPLIYAGNHGLEIRGRGLNYTVPEAQALRFELLAVCNELRASLSVFNGALVEWKGLTASVHLRQVEPAQIPKLVGAVRSLIDRRSKFFVSKGNSVIEIRPLIPWTKGSAARWILQQMHGEECHTICMGDDSTDEDLFTELPNAMTIRIGNAGATAARYRIEQTKVLPFLHFLLKKRSDWATFTKEV